MHAFLTATRAIGAIGNPTERARVAHLAFGRRYASVLELMELDADTLRARLAAP